MQANHLAWHETMELHELVAFQSNVLVQLKKSVKDIPDEELKGLYQYAIGKIEKNLWELLRFYQEAPQVSDHYMDETSFFAGNLLGLTKTAVRNYAIAITETATCKLREVFTTQLNRYIRLHYRVFQYMYQRGYYPSYDLPKLLQGDVRNAKKALELPY
jgi:spore coat protein F